MWINKIFVLEIFAALANKKKMTNNSNRELRNANCTAALSRRDPCEIESYIVSRTLVRVILGGGSIPPSVRSRDPRRRVLNDPICPHNK